MSEAEPAPSGVDPSALLIALVLVPDSYPRNRFYQLFRDPVASEVRRRASRLRSLIADLSGDAEDVVLARDAGGHVLRYRLPELDAKRVTQLSDEELVLVRLAVERAGGVAPGVLDHVEPGEMQALEGRLSALLG